MKIIVSGKQMTVRDSLKAAVEKKLHKFDKFFGDDTDAYVTCRTRKGTKIMEITILYGGTLFRSEAESDTFLTALDRAAENMERQIRKHTTRLEKTVRAGAFTVRDEYDDDEYEEEHEFRVRTKTYPARPMSTEEAILQMNLLEHDFFLFVHADNGRTAAVYRKKNGDYGLLLPEE